MNTNRDKAVSFGRGGGGGARPPLFFFLATPVCYIRSSSGGARAEYRPLAM